MTDHVTAEDAPIGVQLWPTISPGYADHYTLDVVETVHRRTADGVHAYVIWHYRNGKRCQFPLGCAVAVEYPEGYQPA